MRGIHARLSAYVFPELQAERQVVAAPESGYADRLRALIGGQVVHGSEDPNVLRLGFATGEALTISLAPGAAVGVEVAMLQLDDGTRRWTVWNPVWPLGEPEPPLDPGLG